MLDLAATETMTLVRRALARLDFTGELDPFDLHEATGSGRRGTDVLARAISNHLPELAQTRSELEVEFLLLCERYGLPIPQMNRQLHNVRPDAWWPEFDLVVELDGDANHRTPAQRTKDRRKEVILREHGLNVVRYDYDLTMRSPAAVRDDLLRHMGLEPPRELTDQSVTTLLRRGAP
jgi:very-short-patch-repair endonuclease